jgi:MSHA pilin protein MshD
MSTRALRGNVRGVSLVELIVFIVIVGVAMAGLFAAFNTITAASADPQVRKQVLAIAESLMEEVTLMPFTFCDPDDANAATATSSAGCAVASNSEDAAMGPEGGETRYGTPQFDNVSDYHGFAMNPGINDITNAPIGGLGAYSASITVTQAGLGAGANAIAGTEALRISITVTGPGGVSITLEGYRTRYAPNTLP